MAKGHADREELSQGLAEAMRSSRELVRAEAALARAELQHEFKRIMRAAIAMVVGLSLLSAALSLGVVVVCVARGGAVAAVGVASLSLGFVGGGLALWGYVRLSSFSSVMPRTREALANNVSLLRRTTNSQR